MSLDPGCRLPRQCHERLRGWNQEGIQLARHGVSRPTPPDPVRRLKSDVMLRHRTTDDDVRSIVEEVQEVGRELA